MVPRAIGGTSIVVRLLQVLDAILKLRDALRGQEPPLFGRYPSHE